MSSSPPIFLSSAGPSRHFSHLVGLGDHSGQQTASTNYTSENPMLLVQKFNGSPNIP